jgi:ATP-dependent helicase/nuclease subunit B
LEIETVAFGAEAVDALRRVIARGKASDALVAVTVIAPSTYAGLSLRRLLGRDGLVNVGFMPLARLAELAGAPALAQRGLRPLTPAIRAEAVRAALASAPGFFAGVRDHPATQRSLDATFRELREWGDGAVAKMAVGNGRQQSVAVLFRKFRELTEEYYDPTDLAESAAASVRAGEAGLRDIGHVVLFLPRRLNVAQSELIFELAKRGHASVLLGVANDRQADGETALIARRLESDVVLPATWTRLEPGRTRVVTVTDSDEEIRTIIRMIVEAVARGTPLHRMGVAYRAQEPYATLIHERLLAARIPHHGPGITTLAGSVAGRALLALLKLPAHDFRRDHVLDWLTSAPIREQTDSAPAPAQRWDALSRAAGVTAGAVAWGPRLEGHARSLEARAAEIRLGSREGEEPWRATRFDEDAASARRLGEFVRELRSELMAPVAGTYAAHASWARRLVGRYLSKRLWRPGDYGAAPAAQQQRWDEENRYLDEIVAILQGLAGLDSALAGNAAPVTLSVFAGVMETALSARGSRLGPFGDGVFVGPLSTAAGMSFDVVFVPGMVEGQMPPVGREDPLLPDAERRALDVAIPLRSGRRAQERRDWLAVIAGAERRVLFYPRADLRSQSQNLPSRWLLEAASDLASAAMGKSTTLSTEAFMRLLDGPTTAQHGGWLTSVASMTAAVKDGAWPGTEQEYDLRSLLHAPDAAHHFIVRDSRQLRDGISATTARGSARWSQWDGLLGWDDERAPSVARPASPTGLESWAKCPAQYFLKSVLRVAETEKPEETLDIDAAERGTLIHDVLQAFFAGGGEFDSPAVAPRLADDQPWTDEERGYLRQITLKYCNRAEAAGKTGRPLLWSIRRKTIVREMDLFLTNEHERRMRTGLRFSAAELAFGTPGGAPALEVVLTDGRVVAFRGRIDRLERSGDGTRVGVVDYKTGSAYNFKKMDKDALLAGQLLQLPVYGLVAQRATPDAVVRTEYWFISEREKFETKGYELSDVVLGRFDEALTVIARDIERGQFAARPGEFNGFRKTYDNCVYCPYDNLCFGDRDRAWRRKLDSPEIQDYIGLAGDVAAADD